MAVSWEKLQHELSDDFKKDSKEAQNQMNKARSDLSTLWGGSGTAILHYWHNYMQEQDRKAFITKSMNDAVALGKQYGLTKESVATFAPEIINSVKVMSDPNYKIDTFIQEAINSNFNSDLQHVASLYQKIPTSQLPSVKFTRNKTGEKLQYTDPRETMWWFATQRRLLICVFLIILLQSCSVVGGAMHAQLTRKD